MLLCKSLTFLACGGIFGNRFFYGAPSAGMLPLPMAQLKSVLLVDDDTTTNFLNKRLFSRLGVMDDLYVATNGLVALEILQNMCATSDTGCPALILLDVNMSVMNGFEFLDAFNQLPPALREQVVVVVLTTSTSPHDMERARQLRAAGTLNKPLTEAKIRTLLLEYFPLAH